MKLELKHLAPYLPYELKICYRILDLENGNPNTDNPDDRMMDCILKMDGARMDRCLLPETDRWYDKSSIFKPILRPISELYQEVIIGDMKLIPVNTLQNLYGWDYLWNSVYKEGEPFNVKALKYACLEKLLEWHFDVFNLIPAGLAEDINNLTTKLG